MTRKEIEHMPPALRILAAEIQAPDHIPAMCLRDAAAMIETLLQWVDDGKANGARCAEERDRLQDAVRNLRDVSGRHHTEQACRRLYALLPENAESIHPDK